MPINDRSGGLADVRDNVVMRTDDREAISRLPRAAVTDATSFGSSSCDLAGAVPKYGASTNTYLLIVLGFVFNLQGIQRLAATCSPTSYD